MKIDTTKIEGFDSFPEDVKAKILGYEAPDPDFSGYVKKEVFDKKASEAAEASRQLKSKMTEDEQKEAEKQKIFEDMKEELDSLRKANAISDYKAKFISQGYDEEAAAKQAEYLYSGDAKSFFDGMGAFLDAERKRIEQDALKKQPGVSSGKTPGKEDADIARTNKIRVSMGLPPIKTD